MSVKNEVIDGVNVRVPAEPHKLLFEQNQSHFIGCNLTNAQRFYSKYGRDVSPDALLFKKKALQVLSIVVEVLDHLGVRFWLSSGTCLGEWFSYVVEFVELSLWPLHDLKVHCFHVLITGKLQVGGCPIHWYNEIPEILCKHHKVSLRHKVSADL